LYSNYTSTNLNITHMQYLMYHPFLPSDLIFQHQLQ